jgi:hypothetical protein
LSSHCLDRRIPDKQTLIEEIAAGETERNARTKVNWHNSPCPHQTQTPVPLNLIESGDREPTGDHAAVLTFSAAAYIRRKMFAVRQSTELVSGFRPVSWQALVLRSVSQDFPQLIAPRQGYECDAVSPKCGSRT